MQKCNIFTWHSSNVPFKKSLQKNENWRRKKNCPKWKIVHTQTFVLPAISPHPSITSEIDFFVGLSLSLHVQRNHSSKMFHSFLLSFQPKWFLCRKRTGIYCCNEHFSLQSPLLKVLIISSRPWQSKILSNERVSRKFAPTMKSKMKKCSSFVDWLWLVLIYVKAKTTRILTMR